MIWIRNTVTELKDPEDLIGISFSLSTGRPVIVFQNIFFRCTS